MNNSLPASSGSYGIQLIQSKCISTKTKAAYSKLHKVYKELVRQNETIFAAEKECNALEEKQGGLKGLSKLTRKSELQSEIDRINERIDHLINGNVIEM